MFQTLSPIAAQGGTQRVSRPSTLAAASAWPSHLPPGRP
jgi:hypothetical protein